MTDRKLLEEVMAAFNSDAPGHWRVFEIEQVAAEIVRRVEAALAEGAEKVEPKPLGPPRKIPAFSPAEEAYLAKLLERPNTDFSRRICTAMVASCTCDTKSPEIQWHKDDCHYKIFREAEARAAIAAMGE